MATYQLPNGREVFLVRWTIAATYHGVLEGHPELVSSMIRKNLPDRAAGVLPPAIPLAVIASSPGILPKWFCVSELVSSTGIHTRDPDYHSRLYACWFMDDTSGSLDAIVEAILPHLAWEQTAEEYDFTLM